MIPTYIINVKERTDRLNHVKKQFSDKPEFNITVIEAVVHSVGAIGLWESTIKAIRMAQERNEEYILICEDDQQFTKDYNIKKLKRSISEAGRRNADVLLGGIHWFNSVVNVSIDLFWVDKFTATQFIIIYRKFFNTLLETDFALTDDSDLKISDLTDNKFVIYPFISVQKEFGYSDVRPDDSKNEQLNNSFELVSSLIDQMNKVDRYYQSITILTDTKKDLDIHEIIIPCYIISSSDSADRLSHIKKQFEDKPEFEPVIIAAYNDEIRNIGLWKSHCKVIDLAIRNDYDMVIICGDDHEFTDTYSFDFLLSNLIDAHQQGADMLIGGSIDCGLVVPITADRLWADQLLPTQFIVIYKEFFAEILNYTFNENNAADYALTNLTKNKMILSPSISGRKDFDSAIVSAKTELSELIYNISLRNAKRLKKISEAYSRYKTTNY